MCLELPEHLWWRSTLDDEHTLAQARAYQANLSNRLAVTHKFAKTSQWYQSLLLTWDGKKMEDSRG